MLNSYLNKTNYIYCGDSKYPLEITNKLDEFAEGIKVIASENNDYKTKVEKALRLLNEIILPRGVDVDFVIDKKSINKLNKLLDEKLSDSDYPRYIWLLMNAGFILSSIFPINIDEDSLELPSIFVHEREQINSQFEEDKDKIAYMKNVDVLAKKVLDYMYKEDIAVANFIKSGVNGNITHLKELLIGVGLALNTEGKIVDVLTNSLTSGVTPTEYFSNSSQAIGALHAKSSETAVPGYLGKKLNNIAENVKLSAKIDCRTQNYLEIKTSDKDFIEVFIGRWFHDGKKLRKFTKEDASKSVNKKIKFRSPNYCKAQDGICHMCYDQKMVDRFNLTAGANIGIIASTGQTNTLVNLTLKKSHVGIGVEYNEVDLREEIKSMI